MGVIQNILDRFGNQTVQIIQGNLSSTGTDATGQTSRSLQSEPGPNKVKVTGKPFIYVVETGRGPGGFPPLSSMEEWIAVGKVSLDVSPFALGKVIAEKGTKLFREGGREDIITPAVDDTRIDKLTTEIADAEFAKTIKVIEDGIAAS